MSEGSADGQAQRARLLPESDTDVGSRMRLAPKATGLLSGVAVLLVLLGVPMTAQPETSAHRATVEAQFRGCDAAGWCRFWTESLHPVAQSLLRVRPDGVMQMRDGDAIAVRDRLNVLLANMIHQAKHIVLRDLRELEDGTFAAAVSVNDIDLASDAVLLELRHTGATNAR